MAFTIDSSTIHTNLFFRKETRDRKTNFGVDRKEACKNQTQASWRDLYCINATPRNFVKYLTHCYRDMMRLLSNMMRTCYTKGRDFGIVTFVKKSPGSTKQSITNPYHRVVLTPHDIIDIATCT